MLNLEKETQMGIEATEKTVVDAGTLRFGIKYRQELMDDQGIGIEVFSEIDGKEVEILRFDCFDQKPHYHYSPEKENERQNIDKASAGNPLGWTMKQLRTRLQPMIRRAGYEDVANQLDDKEKAALVATKLDEVESIAGSWPSRIGGPSPTSAATRSSRRGTSSLAWSSATCPT